MQTQPQTRENFKLRRIFYDHHLFCLLYLLLLSFGVTIIKLLSSQKTVVPANDTPALVRTIRKNIGDNTLEKDRRIGEFHKP